MNVTTLGIDLAKAVFQLHGVDEHGQVRLTKTVSRKNLLPFLANLPPCKARLLGISKRGDCYLRTLLIHGACAAVRSAERKADARRAWINGLRQRRGKNRAAVALANKNARILWALLIKGEAYHPAS